jgi:hypothetical protein
LVIPPALPSTSLVAISVNTTAAMTANTNKHDLQKKKDGVNQYHIGEIRTLKQKLRARPKQDGEIKLGEIRLGRLTKGRNKP